MMSSKYECTDCEIEFTYDEAIKRKTTMESMYGVAHLFKGSRTPHIVIQCPACKEAEPVKEI